MKITREGLLTCLGYDVVKAFEQALDTPNYDLRTADRFFRESEEIDTTDQKYAGMLNILFSSEIITMEQLNNLCDDTYIYNLLTDNGSASSIISCELPCCPTVWTKTFRAPIPPEVGMRYVPWASDYITGHSEMTRDGDFVVVKTDGDFTAPGATEVTE